MKGKYLKDVMIGAIAGLIIYVIYLAVGVTELSKISVVWRFSIAAIMGVATVIATYTYLMPNVLSMLLRFITMFYSFTMINVSILLTNLVAYVVEWFKIPVGSMDDHLAGLVQGMFFLLILGVTVVFILVISIVQAVMRLNKKNGKSKQIEV